MFMRASVVLSRLEQEEDGCSLIVTAVDEVAGARGRAMVLISGVEQRGGSHFNVFLVRAPRGKARPCVCGLLPSSPLALAQSLTPHAPPPLPARPAWRLAGQGAQRFVGRVTGAAGAGGQEDGEEGGAGATPRDDEGQEAAQGTLDRFLAAANRLGLCTDGEPPPVTFHPDVLAEAARLAADDRLAAEAAAARLAAAAAAARLAAADGASAPLAGERPGGAAGEGASGRRVLRSGAEAVAAFKAARGMARTPAGRASAGPTYTR
jgi:hypothetical protein